MPSAIAHQNGDAHHWVTVHAEPAGEFTAQAVSLPDVRATAATREEALSRVEKILRGLVASGHLVSMDVQGENPLSKWGGRQDPNDPEAQTFLEILAEQRREDMQQTLRELAQECPNSSSTPTT